VKNLTYTAIQQFGYCITKDRARSHSDGPHGNILKEYEILAFALRHNSINLKSLTSRMNKLMTNKSLNYKNLKDERQSTQKLRTLMTKAGTGISMT
jgi:hypothetical protein